MSELSLVTFLIVFLAWAIYAKTKNRLPEGAKSFDGASLPEKKHLQQYAAENNLSVYDLYIKDGQIGQR